jgi:hypothetical protein
MSLNTKQFNNIQVGVFSKKKPQNSKLIRNGIYISLFLLTVDYVYKIYFGITYQNRIECILYKILPKWAFLFYEYFIELFLVVVAGVFIAVILEKLFAKYKKYYPKNQISAFIYASIIPVCSCSVIPIIESMKEKMKFRTLLTFVIAAPLLNPYILVLSFSVLGLKYGLLRIASSLILAITTGLICEFFYKKLGKPSLGNYKDCNPSKNCEIRTTNVYTNTFLMMKKIFPFLLIAGAMGMLFEIIDPTWYVKNMNLGNSWLGSVLVIIAGIPVYFCNGADVIFLKPLVNYTGLSLGTAMAFSLTSTSVCVTSLVMLIKFIGKKLTFILLGNVVLITIIVCFIINLIF